MMRSGNREVLDAWAESDVDCEFSCCNAGERVIGCRCRARAVPDVSGGSFNDVGAILFSDGQPVGLVGSRVCVSIADAQDS
jgi:hypothetical protein